jgi:hypothetical protein
MRRAGIILLAISLGANAAPATAFAQQPDVLSKLGTLDLDKGHTGHVSYYYAPPDAARAEALGSLVDDAAAFFEAELGLGFDLSIAALGPDDWFSEYPGVPYAVPWVSIPEHVLMLPASLSEGVLVAGRDPLADRRRVDFVALHEFGHLASKEFLRPDAAEPYTPVSWFDELLATYFAYCYVAESDPEWAAAARAEWSSEVRSFEPSVRSLDWTFMESLPGPELSRTYGWYQNVLNLQAADLYRRHGPSLLPSLKAALPWQGAQSWTSEALIGHLDGVAPELANWAEGFGRDP